MAMLLAVSIVVLPAFPPSVMGTLVVLFFCGAGCLVLWKSEWRRACEWIALTAASQACFLQLIQAGQESHLPQIYSLSALLRPDRVLFLGATALQVCIVSFAALRRRAEIRALLARLFRLPHLAIVLALLAFAALPVPTMAVRAVLQEHTFGPAISFLARVALTLTATLASLFSLAFAVIAVPAAALDRWSVRWDQRSDFLVPRAAALWAVAASSALCWLAFDGLPHIPDDVAYLFQAKYFAAGRFFLPRPPDSEALACAQVIFDGNRWYSGQLPGWPAVLAIGARLGVAWLVNPLLAGLTLLLSNRLLRRLYDRDVADAAVLLLSLSPWYLYMAATFMGHSASLFFSVLGLYGVLRARDEGSIAGGALAGFSIGMLVNMRPLEAVSIAAAAGVWWLTAGWKKLRIAPMVATAVCGIAMLGLLLAYNKTMTGDLLLSPFQILTEKDAYPGANRIGFGKDVGNFGWTELDVLPGHGPIDVAVNTEHNVSLTNFELYGWPCASLLLVFLLCVWGRWRDDGLQWGILLGVWGAMSCYWFSGGPDYGARYWYQMILPLAVLTVRGARRAGEKLSGGVAELRRRELPQRVWAFVALASLIGAVNVIPWRALDKYKNYRYVRGEVRALARERNFGKSLVFVNTGEKHRLPWQSSPFASAFALNPLTLDPSEPGTIYVRDLGPESVARIRAAYPDRPAWFLQGPGGLSGHFSVTEGPLPPLPH